jgi:type VI secretion system secreted protein VgrG
LKFAAKIGGKSGTLDASGKALVSGLAKGPAKVFFGEDPRNPWDDRHYFGNFDWWPLENPASVAWTSKAQSGNPCFPARRATEY